jgi:uncharacterized LabA/DUF88 family protein
MEVSPLMLKPVERVAIFIDGWNFKYATWDAFGLRVDFPRLLAHLTRDAFLLRAYYYTGEWSDGAINTYLRLVEGEDAANRREELERQRDSDHKFLRFLDRNGFRVVRKPIRVMRYSQDTDLRIKADLDLELAIDMLTLAERCDKQILVSGDGDFVPLVNAVAGRGVRVVVVSTQSDEAYRNGYRASDDLLDAADEFIDIGQIQEHIARMEANGSSDSMQATRTAAGGQRPRLVAGAEDGPPIDAVAVSTPAGAPAETASGEAPEEPAPAGTHGQAAPSGSPGLTPTAETVEATAEDAGSGAGVSGPDEPYAEGSGPEARPPEDGRQPAHWPSRLPTDVDLSGPPIVRDPAVLTREQWLAAKERERAQAASENGPTAGGEPTADEEPPADEEPSERGPTDEASTEDRGGGRSSASDVGAEREGDSTGAV